jgi:hypothetical protein
LKLRDQDGMDGTAEFRVLRVASEKRWTHCPRNLCTETGRRVLCIRKVSMNSCQRTLLRLSRTGVANKFPKGDNATPKEKDVGIDQYLVPLGYIIRGQAMEHGM